MRIRLADQPPPPEELLGPEAEPDASDAGVNYADAYLKPLKRTLEDGRRLTCKRRGLKVTLTIGERKGEGLLRRLEHGPDVRDILLAALREAARELGGEIRLDDGAAVLVVD